MRTAVPARAPHRTWPACLVALALVTTLLATVAGSAGATDRVPSKETLKTVKLARGVVWLRIVDPSGPYRINVLVLTPAKGARVRVVPAGAVLPAAARPSTLATATDAVAAVNGDFGATLGRPVHPFVIGGDLVQTGLQIGSLLALTREQRQLYMGRPALSITVDGAGFAPRKIAGWNGGPPLADQLNGFTDEGGTLDPPPPGTCFARLVSTDVPAWTLDKMGRQQSYTVASVGCGTPPAPAGGVVLATLPTSSRASLLARFVVGQKLSIVRSIGWPGVSQAVGGMPLILADGQLVAPTVCTPAEFCDRNPRTGVGMTPACVTGGRGCRIMLLTVDGRRSRSVGMTFPEMASRFLALGATWALNLDGGGSTTMWVGGEGIVNQPSDGYERSLPQTLVVLARGT